MEAVRLTNGKEYLTLDKNEMARLVEALCEAPMDGAAEPSAELAALRREAAKLLAEAGDNPADADAQIAALAASLSGSLSEAPRDTLVALVPRPASARLDVESAAAFVETIERSTETAPADLVAEFSEAEATAASRPAAGNFWLRIAHGLRPARFSRIAAACAVIVVASAASWSVYWREHEQLAAPPASQAKTDSVAPAVAKAKSPEMDTIKTERLKTESTGPAFAVTAPAPPAAPMQAPAAAPMQAPAAALEPAAKRAQALAARQPCEPKTRAFEAPMMKRGDALSQADEAFKKGGLPTGPGCDAAPAEDADVAIRKAIEDAERARQNAAAPVSAAPAAAAVGAARTEGGFAAQPADPSSASAGRPATTTSTPAAKHPTRPRELSR